MCDESKDEGGNNQDSVSNADIRLIGYEERERTVYPTLTIG